MDIETLKRQRQEALRDASHWKDRAQEAKEASERYKLYAKNRRRDAAYYYSLIAREEAAVETQEEEQQ